MGGSGDDSGSRGDDAHRDGEPRPDGVAIRLLAVPAAASLVRQRLRLWLTEARWPDPELDDVVLAVHEAVTNSIEHGYGGSAPGDVEVLGEIVGVGAALRRVRVIVRDWGRWLPPAHDSGYRGRGLLVIHGCMEAIDVSPRPEGTAVTMLSQAVPAASGRAPRPAPMDVATVEIQRPAAPADEAEQRHRTWMAARSGR